MRRRRSSNPFHSQPDPELDMSPLIDVGFLLLIYFLVATTLLKEEADLGLALPGTSQIAGEPVKIDQLRLRIDAESEIYVNDERMLAAPGDRELAKLTERLVRYAASAELAGARPVIILDCADEAREQRFVDVLNACTKAGIKNVTLMP